MDTEHDTKTTGKVIAYDSNPFTTTWTGIQKLIKTNAQSVVGVALFNILLMGLLIVTVGVTFLSVATFVIKHDDTLHAQYSFASDSPLGFLTNMSDGSIYATWVIGFIICVFLMALMQSLQLNLAMAATKEVTQKFGTLVKQAVKNILPILGFIGLVFLTLLVGSIVIALLSIVIGYISLVVGLIALLAAIYAGLRLSFTIFIIVDQHVGPIPAMKQSWKTTDGHLIETIGSAFVGMLVLSVPAVVITALSRITEGLPLLSGLFSILNAVATTVLVIGATMAIAERYTQIRALNDHKLTSVPLSAFNYGAIVLALFMSFILNALSPKLDNNSPNTDPFTTPVQNDTNNTLYPTTLN